MTTIHTETIFAAVSKGNPRTSADIAVRAGVTPATVDFILGSALGRTITKRERGWLKIDPPLCIICREPTLNNAIGRDGSEIGVICEDCEYFCDGNVIHPRELVLA